MPHIIVEYSANLEGDLSPHHLVSAIHHAALETGVFPLGGLRTRAERRDVFMVADGNPDHGFIGIIARIGEGRDMQIRQNVANALMDTLKRETENAFRSRGLALSVEVQEINGLASLKHNNLHQRLSKS